MSKDSKPAAKPTTKKPAAKKPVAKPAGSAYGDLADMINAGGIGGITQGGEQDYSLIDIPDIQIKPQVRKIMEDAENNLDDLAASILEHGVLQPIVIRPIPGPVPYELVAGERRLRSSMIAGLAQIPALVRELTDVQAAEIQFAENIQRKNLTQIETAERLQTDLDALGGDVEALAAKHQKSRAWISKWLSILDLTPEAQRVIDENISADLEVISIVKQVEKADPVAAAKLVDDLKETKGSKNARQQAKTAKDTVKPSKKKTAEQQKAANPENVAGAIDRSHQEHGPVTSPKLADVTPQTLLDDLRSEVAAGLAEVEQQEQQKKEPQEQEPQEQEQQEQEQQEQEQQEQEQQEQEHEQQSAVSSGEQGNQAGGTNAPALPPAEALHKAFVLISEDGAAPKMVLDCMDKAQRDDCENWLHAFYDAGSAAKDIGHTVLQGFRTGNFSTAGHGAFALAAFLYGSDSEAKFNMLNIMGSVKA